MHHIRLWAIIFLQAGVSMFNLMQHQFCDLCFLAAIDFLWLFIVDSEIKDYGVIIVDVDS